MVLKVHAKLITSEVVRMETGASTAAGMHLVSYDAIPHSCLFLSRYFSSRLNLATTR